MANGITTVHLSYVREKAGHALIGARQRIPREHLADPVKSLLMGLPLDLGFRTRGQLAIGISTDAAADGIRPDFYCRDEVYGSCTQLREHFEAESQAYVLRVPSNFTLTVAAGAKMTCAQAVTALLRHPRRREIRSAGSGSKGERWYAWAWIATASPGHHLLVRRPAEGPHDTQAPPPVRPGQPPPAEPGMIPLTIPELKRLLAALTTRPLPRWPVIHWDAWTRRHQARSRWFHKRARLARNAEPSLVS